MSIFLFYMPEEIEGRELSARFRQGQLYIPKFYRDMFDIKEGYYFVLEVVKHSSAKTKYKPIQKSDLSNKEEKSSPPKESSNASPNPYIDYTKPFKLLDEEDETPWDNDK